MPRKDAGKDALYAAISRRMIESGEWERISDLLLKRLNEAGWVDQVHHESKETARRADSTPVRQLLEQLKPHAESTVPPAVRQEVLAVIRQYLDSQIER
ncbi:transcription factor e(y)2-domain-containing protein [Phanerochaete sordida]|uniref:Transcription and mRNA export factor SUS1 n=1 Tax=Phanerochaete sordida TaxID=48140 RepID=A0A9P3LNI6_9APHY|nr:transcription factor e(y)2-domain-containing protein [Phanerochaete sordida]